LEFEKTNKEEIDFIRQILPDAVQFFAEAAFIIYIASDLSVRFSDRKSMDTIRGIMCCIAAIVFSLPLVASGAVTGPIDFVTRTITDIADLAHTAGVTVMRLWTDPVADVVTDLYIRFKVWFYSTQGNLFAIVSGLSKVLWVLAIVSFLRGLFGRPSIVIAGGELYSLDGREIKVWIGCAAGLAAFLSGITYYWLFISGDPTYGAPTSSFLMMYLWACLFMTSPRLQVVIELILVRLEQFWDMIKRLWRSPRGSRRGRL
jgi:hypothetical protein